jgi:hypothetical protein
LGITIGLSGNLSKTQQSQFAGRVHRGGDEDEGNLEIWKFGNLGIWGQFGDLSYLQI